MSDADELEEAVRELHRAEHTGYRMVSCRSRACRIVGTRTAYAAAARKRHSRATNPRGPRPEDEDDA